MSKCDYDKDGHCILNECMYGDFLKKGEKPMCYKNNESTVERIVRDMTACQRCTYYGKQADAPNTVENDCMYEGLDELPCERK